MQSLRDKLLKAGLVTEQQVKEAERKHKDKGPRPSFQQRQKTEGDEERQRREAYQAREAEQAEERRREAAKKAEARAQSERALRIRQLVDAHRLRDSGEVNFHYVKRSGKIGRVAVTPEVAERLEQGHFAVVEDPGQPECVVVPREAALRIREVDEKAVRFFVAPDAKVGFQEPASEVPGGGGAS